MLTKTDCLSEELNPQSSAINLEDVHLRDAIFYGMNLFAKEVAVAFTDFCNNGYKYMGYDEWRLYETHISYSTEQLFELFLQSINQK